MLWLIFRLYRFMHLSVLNNKFIVRLYLELEYRCPVLRFRLSKLQSNNTHKKEYVI